MNSVVKCLVTIFSLSFSITTPAQETQYITGVGAVMDSYGSIDVGRSIKAARQDLYEKIIETTGKHVVNHTTLANKNGEYDYRSVTAVDSGIMICENDIQYIPCDWFIIARIERSKVVSENVTWKEEHITINNTYHAPTAYSNGYRINVSMTRTTRRTDVVGPSGRIARSIPGQGSTTITRSRWNGRCGLTWETTKNDR